MPLSLLSLNIERERHIDLVLPFLKEQQPDVACIYEVFETDVPKLAEALGAIDSFFVPMMRNRSDEGVWAVEGNAVFSKYQLTKKKADHYAGNAGAIADYVDGTPDEKDATSANFLVSAEVEKEGVTYAIKSTHFCWTPDGSANDIQRAARDRMFELLSGEQEFVLAGDFNAPRGGELFESFAERYRDNIPLEYTTSIDIALHRNGKIRPEELATKMVDVLFTTPGYRASDVRLIPGVSDHMAVVASIEHT